MLAVVVKGVKGGVVRGGLKSKLIGISAAWAKISAKQFSSRSRGMRDRRLVVLHCTSPPARQVLT